MAAMLGFRPEKFLMLFRSNTFFTMYTANSRPYHWNRNKPSRCALNPVRFPSNTMSFSNRGSIMRGLDTGRGE